MAIYSHDSECMAAVHGRQWHEKSLVIGPSHERVMVQQIDGVFARWFTLGKSWNELVIELESNW